MTKKQKGIIPLTVIAPLLLNACGPAATANPTEVVAGIYTAAAQTVAARSALSTATPQPTETSAPSTTPTTPPTATLGAPANTSAPLNTCDNSIYVSDVTIPDRTVMSPGTEFDKTWSIKNIGTCTWTTNYTINFAGGEAMSGVKTKISQAVAPLQSINVTVSMVAPDKSGDHTGYWKLANEAGTSFGMSVYLIITVNSDLTMTVTPTRTGTPATATTHPSSTPTSPVAASKTPTTPTTAAPPSATTAPSNTPEPSNTAPPPTETPITPTG